MKPRRTVRALSVLAMSAGLLAAGVASPAAAAVIKGPYIILNAASDTEGKLTYNTSEHRLKYDGSVTDGKKDGKCAYVLTWIESYYKTPYEEAASWHGIGGNQKTQDCGANDGKVAVVHDSHYVYGGKDAARWDATASRIWVKVCNPDRGLDTCSERRGFKVSL